MMGEEEKKINKKVEKQLDIQRRRINKFKKQVKAHPERITHLHPALGRDRGLVAMETHQPGSTTPLAHLVPLQVDAGGKERCTGALCRDPPFQCQRKGHKSPGVLQEAENPSDILLSTHLYLHSAADE